MTKEEAIEWFEFLKKGFENTEYKEYLSLAIKALEQEPCEDAISRAELLKAIDTWDKFGYTETGCFVREPKNDCVKYIHYDDVIECIKGMPSVNPQKPICPSAGIDCEDCPAYEPKTGHSSPEGATNKDIFKAIFGYEPATDSVVCNKEDWCGASEPCNYCLNNSNSIGREEDWWNAPYKSEWQHDHEILKAYSDGASAVLDKIRAEIDAARFLDKDKKLFKNANASGLEVAMDIIDKYKAEGSGE